MKAYSFVQRAAKYGIYLDKSEANLYEHACQRAWGGIQKKTGKQVCVWGFNYNGTEIHLQLKIYKGTIGAFIYSMYSSTFLAILFHVFT